MLEAGCTAFIMRILSDLMSDYDLDLGRLKILTPSARIARGDPALGRYRGAFPPS